MFLQCYACGEYGHIANDCLGKGLGKGKQGVIAAMKGIGKVGVTSILNRV